MTLTQSKNMTVFGLVFSAFTSIALIGSSVLKFVQPAGLLEPLNKIGIDQNLPSSAARL